MEVALATGYTRNGGDPFGGSQAVIDAVFDPSVLQDGRISDIIEIDINRSVVIQVTEYHAEARKSLEEVSASIRFSLQSERALNMVQDRARRFVEALQDGETFESAAIDVEAEVSPSVVVGRQNDTLDGALLNEIFRARKPLPGKARIESTVTTTGDYAVFMVTAVIPGRPESIPLADRDARKNELQAAAGASDFSAYVSQLELRVEIERSDDALQQQDSFQ
jgi:peptidyl-prolyl cis-trans isomerase D